MLRSQVTLRRAATDASSASASTSSPPKSALKRARWGQRRGGGGGGYGSGGGVQVAATRSVTAAAVTIGTAEVTELHQAAATAVSTYTGASASTSDVDGSVYSIALLAETFAAPIDAFLGPFFSLMSIALIARIVMSWYPEIKDNQMPWLIAYLPTEPLLKPTRKAIPAVGGVDLSPIVWFAIISFFNEILLGPQGILKMLQR